MSENHDQEYFSDGLSEELIDLLANIPDLKVPARTSSFYFKGKATTIAEIARTLHVSHVLEGSVRKSGEMIRVTAQLNRADTGYHLWSQTYERNIKDVFKVQDEIAAAVVEALKAKLAPTKPVYAHRSSNAQAYNEYLRGREFSKPGNLEGFRRAIEAYQKAIGFDANYAAAYAGLAESEALLADATGDAAALEQADADAAMAVALAPAEAVGYAARGWLRSAYSWDWAGAQADLAKALALDPANLEVQSRYASLLSYMGLLPQAVAAAKKAIDLDPLSSPDWGQLGRYLMLSGDFRASGEALRRALDIQPESIYGLNNRVTLLLREGKASEALATARKVDDDSLRLYGIALAEHALGHAREARAALDELIAKHAQEAAYQIAWVFAWRGETGDAIEWLERAYRQRDGGLAEVKVDPVFVRLRGDARYQALLKKMNFSE
jgi:TolB-like protein